MQQIAKQIKAKGLQKLRWYCEMCKKQCRDDNGFKNHCMSESHQRNMSHFSEHSGSIVRDNSKVFESSFVKLLSHRHGTKRIHSNLVYQEYIADRHHVHMSGTRWNSLRSFCYHLAQQGTITVEENDKGVFITWIDTSPTLRAKQDALAKKLRMEKSEAERDDELLQQMMAKANEAAAASSNSKLVEGETSEKIETKELIRDSTDEPIKLQMQVKPTTFGKPGFGSGFKKFEPKKLSSLASSSSLKRPAASTTTNSEAPSNSTGQRKLTALEEIIQEEQRKKQRIESGLGRR